MIVRYAWLAALGLISSGTAPAAAATFPETCLRLATQLTEMGVLQATFQPAGSVTTPSGPVALPDHCVITGELNRRTGIDGSPYAFGIEIRLPAEWNGKFFFQGGGGADGVVRPALGLLSGQTKAALSKGYAVASTDAGHKELPGAVGPYLFGLDPQARIDKGYYHIPVVYNAAKALIQSAYGRVQTRSYFLGCSNGGRQGMAATQRYADMFDGIVAGAPAYRVPRAAIDAVAQVQAFAAIAPKLPDGSADLGSALSGADLKLIADGVLEACDGLDGVKDGMVNNVRACKFDVGALACKAGQNSACLAPEKAAAVKRVFDGAKLSDGKEVYSAWPYDPGINSPGWTAWRLGTPGKTPWDARNATLIPGSIAYYFSTPPEKVTDLVDYTLKYNLDRDLPKIEAVAAPFNESGWSLEGAPSTDVTKFKERGGKMIFYHGMADAIFSPLDTLRYIDQLRARYGADTPNFARAFLVPGMNHCAGGPATDEFDALGALEAWVEKGEAPARIEARARNAPGVPWPGRTRPLCAYPEMAVYKGAGDVEASASFECK